MINEYVVKITEQAEEQLREIAYYISNEVKIPSTAKKLLDIMGDEINKLSQFPQRISLVDEEPWRTEGIHKMIIKNFNVYFWIDEENLIVQITGIIYSRRDQVKQLLKMNI